MLDSGSRRPCIRENVVRRLRLPVQKNENGLDELYSADGSLIKNLGTADIDFRVGDYNMFGKFQILKSLIFPIILGIDFMQDHQVQMDYASNTVINNLESTQM